MADTSGGGSSNGGGGAARPVAPIISLSDTHSEELANTIDLGYSLTKKTILRITKNSKNRHYSTKKLSKILIARKRYDLSHKSRGYYS